MLYAKALGDHLAGPRDPEGYNGAIREKTAARGHRRLIHLNEVITADGGTFDEAIAHANNTEYGLAAYIYTRDVGRGMRVASRIEAGMIGLNRGLMSDPAAPFGGVKQSGLGREGGQHHGIAEFMEAKYVAVTF